MVQYGDSAQRLLITKGVHSAYLPVHGNVTTFAISGLGGHGICVGVRFWARPKCGTGAGLTSPHREPDEFRGVTR